MRGYSVLRLRACPMSDPLRILLLGASGLVGRGVLEQAVGRGTVRLIGLSPAAAVQRATALAARSTEQLRLGRIKIVADGSIQGFSARLRWPT